MQEQQRYQIGKVSALLADSDELQCNYFKMFCQGQSLVELCAVAQSGERVLEIIHKGLHPQVLVLDAMLPGCGALEVLNNLPLVAPDYMPHILITSIPLRQEVANQFLTLGAHYIILKPYGLSTLFDAIYQYGSDGVDLQLYRVRRRLYGLLRDMGVGTHHCGVGYLEQMIARQIVTGRDYIPSELYAYVANNEHLTPGAVTSGVRRLVDIARGRNTEAYQSFCAACGLPVGARMTNAVFLHGVAEDIRRVVCR